MKSFRVSGVVPATPAVIYESWLDGKKHSAFTGGKATIQGRVGGRFTVWDGYAEGTTLALEQDRRIVQSWRASDFPDDSPDSTLEVSLEPTRGGTRVTFRHSKVPDANAADLKQGWIDFYLTPMREYFSTLAVRRENRTASMRRKPR